jgi:hypothetical protein
MLTYIVPLACIILLIIEQLQLPCQLRVLHCSLMSSSCIILLIIEQCGVITVLIQIAVRIAASSPIFIILLIIEQLWLPCQLILKD